MGVWLPAGEGLASAQREGATAWCLTGCGAGTVNVPSVKQAALCPRALTLAGTSRAVTVFGDACLERDSTHTEVWVSLIYGWGLLPQKHIFKN